MTLYRAQLRKRWAQELLAAIGIAAGVALIYAALVANASVGVPVHRLTQTLIGPNRDQILKRCNRNSELTRERLGPPRRFAYGPTAIEGLDVFTSKVANAPVNV